MIKYIKGDLLKEFEDGTVDTIAHCCNCQGVMGSGIALSIKNKYPSAFAAYKDHEDKFKLLLGSVSVDKQTDRAIVNLHAQNLYGSGSRFVNYEALYVSLTLLKHYMIGTNLKQLGVPYKMASDRAGGDWRIVEAMLESVFDSTPIEVVVVEYSA